MIKDAAPLHPESSKWYWMQWEQTELNGAAIATSSWTVPAGLTKVDEAVSGLLVGIKLSVNTAVLGDDIDIQNKIITSLPETLNESLRIRIRESGH